MASSSRDDRVYVQLPIAGPVVDVIRDRVTLFGQLWETGRAFLGLLDDASVVLEGDTKEIASVVRRRLAKRAKR